MRNKVILAVLAASAGWGLAGVGTRVAYEAGASTLTVLSIRTAVATVALAIFVIALRPAPSARAWKDGTLIGVLRVGINPMLFMGSLNFISAGVEGLVITLIPATTAVLASFTIKEKVTRPQILGLVIGLAGTLVIGLSGDSGLGVEGDIAAGFALAGAGVIVGSVSGILQRHLAPRHDTISLAMPMFLSGTVVAVVVGSIVGFDDVATFDNEIWLLLVILGLGSTLMPFGLTLYASKHAPATIVAMTAYLAPLVAVIGGALILGEELTVPIIIGACLAIVGVALVGRPRRTTT
jgi:drug/metabolite transporter (DMT)-like permease